ncbi:hypothetical protein BDB01DRAFT_799621 [Pilobolus umbonatus]|nr:hypothetical protein BDB01DRAFT_799621 [Pilobolus umbonatus]
MGKKRKSKQMRPWCWYCEKDFEDDKVLVTHQRAKHFKCEECGKKLTTTGGMVVHAHQVHKIDIYKVPNAMPGRDSLDIEIFGMEGIPEEDMIAHEARLAGGQHNNKKSKSAGSGQYGELTLEDIQKQMAAHKAGGSGSVGLGGVGITNNTYTQPAAVPIVGAPTAPLPINTNYYGAPVPYGQPPFGYQQSQYNQYYPPQNGYPPVPPNPSFGMRPPTGSSIPMNDGQWRYPPYGNAVPSVSPPVSTPPPATTLSNANQTPIPSSSHSQSLPYPPPSSNQEQPKPTNHSNSNQSIEGGSTKKKPTKMVLIFSDNILSPEEYRARLDKHRV